MRVSILADPFLLRWQREAIRNIQALDGVDVTLAIVDASVLEDSEISQGTDVINDQSIGLADVRFFFELLRSRGLYPLVYADQKLGWLLGDGTQRQRYLESEPIDGADCLSDVPIRYCEPVPPDGSWKTIPDDVVDEVVEESDVVVRFGFGLLTGRIIEEPKHGVLSAHGSDIRDARGLGPQTVFLAGKDEVTVTLQQLTTDIDGGNVVCMLSKAVEKPYTLSDVWGWVNEIQTEIYAEGIRRLSDPNFEPQPPETLGEYYSKSRKRSASFVLKLLVKNNWARLQKGFERVRN